MLIKLMKYDMKSLSRAFIPMWILAPIVAMLFSFSIRGMIELENNPWLPGFMNAGNGILLAVTAVVFIGVIVGLMVMTILFIIQRFWNGLLKEEGYLMFTLPVKTWELIVSKALVATLVTCISSVVAVFSCVVLGVFSSGEVIRTFAYMWRTFLEGVIEIDLSFWVHLILLVLLGITGAVKSIYHLYAAMSMGQLFEGHRVAGSCVSYIGISIAFSVIAGIIGIIVSYADPDFLYRGIYYNGKDLWGIFYLSYTLFLTMLQIVIFHVISERILATKLNLE